MSNIITRRSILGASAGMAALAAGGFAPAPMPDGSFALGADEAHGVALFFG